MQVLSYTSVEDALHHPAIREQRNVEYAAIHNDENAFDMSEATIEARLAFLRAAEALKNVLRSGHTSTGRAESTAEHSWRLCLMALVFEDGLQGLDMLKVLKLCVVHDLAEAIHGDIPAVVQVDPHAKSTQERRDLLRLTGQLDPPLRENILSLWEEYEQGATPEAQAVKAMDKLETILQHNQGQNPPGFDYAFNLRYGRQYTSSHPLFAAVRETIDGDTHQRMNKQPDRQADASTMKIRTTSPVEFDAITDIWEASVRATHHFLAAEDIAALRPLVRNDYLPLVELRVAVDDNDSIQGFVGVADRKIEMLFIAPDRRGSGIGTALLRHAIAQMGVEFVDVNEQNPDAVDFYKRKGFDVVNRSPVDGQGKPFPLLQMRLNTGG